MVAKQRSFFGKFEERERSPIARRSDPATSHLAAAEITESGVRDRQVQAVSEAVRKWPGKTSNELGAIADFMDRYIFARRLPEAERLGLVKRGEPRVCAVSRKKALTWWPVD